MKLVQVDIIRTQPAQALLAGIADMLRRPQLRHFREALALALLAVDVVSEFGGDHKLVPLALESLLENGFPFPKSICICRIIKGNARVQCFLQ
ncbi:hypothetical protein D3C76_1530780 [compost metagenome]